MGGNEVRKVAVALTVMVDYDKLYEVLIDDKGRKFKGSWSPAMELAHMIAELPGVHEVVSVANMTVQNTGQDFEESPAAGGADAE